MDDSSRTSWRVDQSLQLPVIICIYGSMLQLAQSHLKRETLALGSTVPPQAHCTDPPTHDKA